MHPSLGEAAMADDYQMLEELGSKWLATRSISDLWDSLQEGLRCCLITNSGPGGSFGVVYKAVDRNTGELVAIKHV